ncbi:MAG TPA: flagellar biosynthetic protein FliO [Janthinobacterium sp.]|jgi:flagellar protein FliO/FliZ|nr:flagellar biosynthetic protein FliO [Janthinobacterium sp.]
MKPGLFLSLAAACCFAHAAAPLPASIPSASIPPASALAAASAATADKGAIGTSAATSGTAAPAGMPAAPMRLAGESGASSTGSLLQTVLGLVFVLALLAALAWFLKRYGPRNIGGNAALRLVGTLSLGGRERIVVVEVADQWIVVGASPGRLNALATLPRQEILPPGLLAPQNGLAATNFSEWLKQTIEKRNGK